jgi:hypothetical protein
MTTRPMKMSQLCWYWLIEAVFATRVYVLAICREARRETWNGGDHAMAELNVVVPASCEIGKEDQTMGSGELFGLRQRL